MYTNFCDEYFHLSHIFERKVAGGRSSSVYFCDSNIFKTIIVNFSFFILNKNTLRFACYKKYTKIKGQIIKTIYDNFECQL